MAARMAMMATTIISSMRVKPCCFFMVYPLGVIFEFHVPHGRRSGPLGSRAELHVHGYIRRCRAKSSSGGSGRQTDTPVTRGSRPETNQVTHLGRWESPG